MKREDKQKASSWTLERHHAPSAVALAMTRPCIHKLKPTSQRIGPTVGALHAANNMRQDTLADLSWERGLISRPIPQAAAKAVDRVVGAKLGHNPLQDDVAKPTVFLWRGKYVVGSLDRRRSLYNTHRRK